MTPYRRVAPLAAALIVYFLLARQTAVAGYIWSNEAWFASPAFTLIHKGYLGTTIVESQGTWMEGIDRHTYWIPPLHSLLQALWYWLFGFGLLQLRYLSIVAGAVVLLSWYGIVSLLTGNRGIALLSIVIPATDARFLMFAALGRPDAACAAFGTLGWLAYLHLRERSLPQAVLAGSSLTAASCLVHPCGELYASGLLLLGLYFDRRRVGGRHFFLLTAPYAAAFSAWGLYIFQAPSQFAGQILGNIGGIGTEFTGVNRLAGVTSLPGALRALTGEYSLRYGVPFGRYATGAADRTQLFALLIYTLGVAGCLLTPGLRNHRGYRALLGLGLLEYLTLGFLDGFKSSGYLIHTLPLAGALLAIYVYFLFSQARRALLPVLAAALILFAAVQFTALGRSFSVTPERWDYKNALAFLRRSGSSSRIIAAGEFAFALGFDSGMVDDWRLGYFSGRRPPFIAANVIYSGWLQHSAGLDPAIHAYMLRLLRDEYRVAFRNSSYTIYQRIGTRQSMPFARPEFRPDDEVDLAARRIDRGRSPHLPFGPVCKYGWARCSRFDNLTIPPRRLRPARSPIPPPLFAEPRVYSATRPASAISSTGHAFKAAEEHEGRQQSDTQKGKKTGLGNARDARGYAGWRTVRYVQSHEEVEGIPG
jgi:4-amino-4-deoxy-L-arabinose transferase-like glycosyltransferase